MRPGSASRVLALACVLTATVGCADRSTSWSEAEASRIRDELVRRAAEDQEIRSVDFSKLTNEQRNEAFARSRSVDRGNTEWLKSLVAERGWPTVDRVGPEAAHGAFLIVQHADHDPQFQAECLPLLIEAGERREIPMRDVAYLTDRVRVKQNKPQLYGTQYYVRTLASGAAATDESGAIVYLLPIVESPETLDDRRLEAGLGPWREYERKMAESHGRRASPKPRAWDGRLPVEPQG